MYDSSLTLAEFDAELSEAIQNEGSCTWPT